MSLILRRGGGADAAIAFERSSATRKARLRDEMLGLFWDRRSRSDFDANEVIPGLWLGSVRAAMAQDALVTLNVRHILTVARNMVEFGSEEDAKQTGSRVITVGEHAVVEIDDVSDQCLLEGLAPALAFLDECLARNDGGVLVHCAAGVSRSATVVTAFLMTRKQMTFQQALQHVKSARSVVYPNPGFIAQLQLLERFQGDPTKALQAYRSGNFSREAFRWEGPILTSASLADDPLDRSNSSSSARPSDMSGVD